MKIVYFHRNKAAGFSIEKVSQTVSRGIENKVIYNLPCSGVSLKSILTNIIYIIRHREKGAIHHITGDVHYGILGLIGYKSVLTIHDTVGIDFKKMSPLKGLFYRMFWFVIPIRIADRVVCISHETKKSIERFSKRNDITVIHNAVDIGLKYFPLQSLGDLPKILFIGVTENKNLFRCFEALANIKCVVTIIGRLNSDLIRCLGENKILYENKWNLTDEEIYQEYASCDIVSFCSLFEGFGMPILEAQQVGRPVICSSLPVLKEVAGDAACFVDPYSVDSIRNGYLRLMSDSEYRNDLVRRGQNNIRSFLPSDIRKEWQKLYSSI